MKIVKNCIEKVLEKISKKNIANYSKSKRGTKELFNTIGHLSECMCIEKNIDESWKEKLEQTD